MATFIDPRSGPEPSKAAERRTTADPEALQELHRLCAEGRLYEVEAWIREGWPLQREDGRPTPLKRTKSALRTALERKDHSLALLLLCNGYDPNLEPNSPLDIALTARRPDLVDLLLEWGADPHGVDPFAVFGTYSSDAFERFKSFGVDLTDGHALGEALADHTSNKPLFGFAKRHREHDPRIQTDLNAALACHASEGNKKGVALSLWAGADPHAPAPSVRYPNYYEDDDEEEEDRFIGFTAVYEACSAGHAEILERLGPDPERDDFGDLYAAARTTAVIDVLARVQPPDNAFPILRRFL